MKYYLYFLLILLLFGCSAGADISPSQPAADISVSKGGSTATFAIVGDYLYLVDNDKLVTYSIIVSNELIKVSEKNAGNGVETIFPFGNMLFLGTMEGVSIFDISAQSSPRLVSSYSHIVACDPVVTDGQYAYLTLRSGTNCGRPVNELQVLDVTDVLNPDLLLRVPMTNPKGLALDGNTLYICDDGVKIFDVSNPHDPRQIDHIKSIPANDIIIHRGQMLVTSESGFYQFEVESLKQVSYHSYSQ